MNDINGLTTNKIYLHSAWIPVHAGIEGDEKADSLAKSASCRGSEQTTSTLLADELKNYPFNVCKCNEWDSELMSYAIESVYSTGGTL